MGMVHMDAGHRAPHELLENIPRLVSAYYTEYPNPELLEQRVSFGTSGHRGSSLSQTFNEEHIYAITQAVCDYRKTNDIQGPLFLGYDTHALSEAAFRSALEVLVANGVSVRISKGGVVTATPAISHAILSWNADHQTALADGIVITPSHNPPRDGGFKYNPPHGGPAEATITKWIEARANEYLLAGNTKIRLTHFGKAIKSSFAEDYDFVSGYVQDLEKVLDLKAIARSGIKLGVDPLGGASLPLWEQIAERHNINLTLLNRQMDPRFSFVPCDKDGQIRMDCSSPYVMQGVCEQKDLYDLCLACDPDADRHGVVTRDGLMNPNHFLAVSAWYLFRSRAGWSSTMKIGKTIVTSAMLDRLAKSVGRAIVEVPVGFKWFVPYLMRGECSFVCEESAGASFLCFDGKPWSTDKDGPLMCLLAAEIMARENKSPSEIYTQLTKELGKPSYQRLDAPADDAIRQKLGKVTVEMVYLKDLAGESVESVQIQASGNGEKIGGVRVASKNGWFAVRPSGTEAICKVYTESFLGDDHLASIQKDALDFLDKLLKDN